jgi:hypothetical protein
LHPSASSVFSSSQSSPSSRWPFPQPGTTHSLDRHSPLIDGLVVVRRKSAKIAVHKCASRVEYLRRHGSKLEHRASSRQVRRGGVAAIELRLVPVVALLAVLFFERAVSAGLARAHLRWSPIRRRAYPRGPSAIRRSVCSGVGLPPPPHPRAAPGGTIRRYEVRRLLSSRKGRCACCTAVPVATIAACADHRSLGIRLRTQATRQPAWSAAGNARSGVGDEVEQEDDETSAAIPNAAGGPRRRRSGSSDRGRDDHHPHLQDGLCGPRRPCAVSAEIGQRAPCACASLRRRMIPWHEHRTDGDGPRGVMSAPPRKKNTQRRGEPPSATGRTAPAIFSP